MKDTKKRFTDFFAGAVLALAMFAALVSMGGALYRLPGSGYAKGMAVMSARLNSLGAFHEKKTEPDESEPKKSPVSVSPAAAEELIRLSGFGGRDIESAPKETQEPVDGDAEEKEEGALLYPDGIDNNDGKIVRKTYSYKTSSTYLELPGGGLLRNCTDIDPEYLLEQCAREPDFEVGGGDEPLVLIMHTHTTESYEPYERDFYDSSFSSRTTEPEKSVVAVGERIADGLRAAGIGVIHDRTVHDYPEFTGAYDRSAETVKKYLEEYPSIKIVIDVHRDAMEENGVRYAPAADVNGKSAAQVMIICGCMNVPQYRYNLRVASRLQSQMEADWQGLTRPILFDERNYNQELTHGSFLIEMGSNANSLDEALYSGELVGKSLAKVIEGMRG